MGRSKKSVTSHQMAGMSWRKIFMGFSNLVVRVGLLDHSIWNRRSTARQLCDDE
jgi:hypothetical protein